MENNKTLTILIGCLVNDTDYERLISGYFKKSVSVSNLAYEKKLFDGFKSADVGDVIFLSAPVVGTFPFSSKKMIVNGFEEKNGIIPVSYSSLFGIRNLSKSISLRKKLKELLEQNKNKYKCVHVIACECHKPYLDCLRMAKESFNVKTTLIIPDLPRYVGKEKGRFYRLLKKMEDNRSQKLINNYVDSFVCFTKDINKEVNKMDKPFIISEGIMNEIQPQAKRINKEKIVCTYIGKLDIANGIELLIESSKVLPPNIKIHVYGSGKFGKELMELSSNQLVFHGFVSPDEVPSILKESDILLSPRYPEGEYLRYSFPSKIFDYLSFCKPIVTFKLPCYFEELDTICIYLDNKNPEELVKKILLATSSNNDLEEDAKIIYFKHSAENVALEIHRLGFK